ncbi:MAG: MFS transporter [Pseudonocardia sp.]
MSRSAPDSPPGSVVLAAVLTAAMALPMLVLYSIGTLAPLIVADLGIGRSELGSLTAVCFGVAAVLSVGAGQVVDRIGNRAAAATLFAVVAAVFSVLSISAGFTVLFAAVAACGVAQALANPATNKIIAQHVSPARRARMVGVKQSGVQVAALVAVVLLVVADMGTGWRAALAAVVPVAIAAGVAALFLVPRQAVARRPFTLPPKPGRPLAWLMAYQLCLGVGLSAVATFVPLFAHEELGTSELIGALLLAGFAVAGIAARIGWTSRAGGRADLSGMLLGLSFGAAVFVGLLASAALLGAESTVALPLTWAAAIGIGATAVAANAVSMLAVVRDTDLGPVAPSSALVSAAFFGGFAVGAPAIGAIADTGGGFTGGWLVVAGVLTVGGSCATGLRRARRRVVTTG